jgi:hypothetical protein
MRLRGPTPVLPAVLVTALLSTALAFAGADEAREGRWRGPDGGFLPFTDDAEALEFLRQAEVVDRETIPQGINKPLKVRLVRGDVFSNAVFRTADVRKARYVADNQVLIDFHDSYIYECAAYEVSRLLGLDVVPPCVVREIGRLKGTLQLWVEEAMTEEKRRRLGEMPPSPAGWMRQRQTMLLFDALIYNFDRNQGNMLVDTDWKLWFIDHTRSFARSEKVPELERILWVRRDVWRGLQALDRAVLEERLGELVDTERLDAVIERRDVLVRHVEALIAERGEDVVLFDE